MDFSSNLRKKASNLKMPLAVNYSFLSCPGYAMLKAGDFPCSPECSSTLWVTGIHFYLMKFWGIFSALQDMGKISFYGTKCSKALPWDKDLNLTDSPKDWGLWLNRGGWLRLDQLVRLGLPAVSLHRCLHCWWICSNSVTIYIFGIFLILHLQDSTTCFVFSKTTVEIHLCF